MHFSKEVQVHLDKLNSPVKVGATIYGALPDKCAFFHEGARRFSAEFATNENEFSIALYERRSEQKYNHCFARGIFNDIGRLAAIIDLWIDKKSDASEIKNLFDELELFDDFKLQNSNPEINYAWTKVKNMLFGDLSYWKTPEWNEKYLELLNEAKEHNAFEKLFPFTSHYWLRFSIDRDLKETWKLGMHIIPTFNSEGSDEVLGRFYVSYNDVPMGGQHFETAKEALDFYADKLSEEKPTRWVD